MRSTCCFLILWALASAARSAPSSQEMELVQALEGDPQLDRSLSHASDLDSSQPIKLNDMDEMEPSSAQAMMNGFDFEGQPSHGHEDTDFNAMEALMNDPGPSSESLSNGHHALPSHSERGLDLLSLDHSRGFSQRRDARLPMSDMDTPDRMMDDDLPQSAASIQEKRRFGSNSLADEFLPLVGDNVDASKVMEGLNEDRITAEIEDLQAKLGSLQANIDKVLSEVA